MPQETHERLQLHVASAHTEWLRKRAESEDRSISATVRKIFDDLIAQEAKASA